MTRTKTRANANMPNNFVSVLDFGAVGDGVTDDAPAIKAADVAAASLGHALYFPSGTYAVDLNSLGSSLTMTTSWIGEDRNTTKILRKDFKSGNYPYILTTYRSRYLTLKGLTFDGQVTTSTSNDPNVDPAAPGRMASFDNASESAWSPSYGVQFEQCQNINVLECNFRNFLRAGLRIHGGWNKNYETSGTYTSTDTTIVVNTSTPHGYSGGDAVYVLFKTGQTGGQPVSTYYNILIDSDTQFTITNYIGSATTTGTCSTWLYEPSDTKPIGDGSNYRLSKNITVSDCYVERTRGIYGDSFYFSATENLTITNCSAYDYTRIAYTFEFSNDQGGIIMPCKNVVMSDCISEFGHDAIQSENNIGLWVECGSQMRFTNVSHSDTGMGFVLTTNKIDPSFDGPADAITLVNCNSRGTRRGLEIVCSDRSVTFDIIGCNFEANEYAAPYAYLYRGYAANCYLTMADNDETNGDSQRRVVNFTNCTFKNIGYTTSRHFGTIFCNKGEATSDTNVDMNTINITDCTSDWYQLGDSPSGYIQNKDAVVATWEQGGGDSDPSLRYHHWGDLVICGAQFTDAVRGGPSSFIGRMNVNNFKNLTTGYALVALESRSNDTEFRFDNTALQMTEGDAPASGIAGYFYINNSSLVDFMGGDVGSYLVVTNSTVKDANPSAPKRELLRNAYKYTFSDCTINRPLQLFLRGGNTATNRPLQAFIKGCHFEVDTNAEGFMLNLGMASPLWVNVNLTSNTFDNNPVTGSPSGDESIIYMPVASGAYINIIGGNNVYDQTVPHVCQYNNTPTYNDDPTSLTVPWDYMVTGNKNFFST